MSDNNNWNSRKNNRRHPRGLRGKDIGLYYRDLHQNNKEKTKKENQTNFRIPPAILNRVQSNLDYISLIAASENYQVCSAAERQTVNEADVAIKTEMNSSSPQQTTIKQETSEGSVNIPIIKQEKMEEDVTLSCDTVKSNLATRTIKEEDVKPGSSNDFIPIGGGEIEYQLETGPLSLRNNSFYKYSYQDIITGTFDEKLDEQLSQGLSINNVTEKVVSLNQKFQEELRNMVTKSDYKKMMKFRETLPTYKKSKDLLHVVQNNQVVVISGETGCGKSTQVPQIILDDAIVNGTGACVNILVTQPRRIAASSLAMRVASERAEKLGNSVGYAVRLDKIDARERGSITFCTTGILLAELEVNQSLSKYSHIILDEVHERDSHIDLSMCMLKRVLKKRKDLKLILMSATLDAKTLSAYFDNCPLMHIEGLAYPVKDVYLEDILQMINYKPRFRKPDFGKGRFHYRQRKIRAQEEEREIKYRAEVHPWLNKIRNDINPDVYNALQDPAIEELNIEIILQLLQKICNGEPGAILVFLPGIGEISKLIRLMNDSKMFPSNRYDIYPLHSKLATLDQHKIFERPKEGVRKIVIATNIAETSITIDDVVYVIDCGKIKYNGLNITQNITTLKVEWIAQANMRQRRGRAGRCQPGICYHLVSSFRASELDERILPELQRSNLLESVLALKQLRLGFAADAFKTVPSPPAAVTVERAVKHLQQIGALDGKETLTPLGWHLARLPVHPSAGKLLVFGALFGILDRAASVAAVWGFKDPFNLVIGKEMECSEMKRQLTLGETSDHVAISEAIIQWENISSYQERKEFAYKYFLSEPTLKLLSEMKIQLADSLRQMGFISSGSVKEPWANRNSNNLSLFKAVIAASLYPNVGNTRWLNLYGNQINKDCKVLTYTPENGKVCIHPSSVLCGPKGPNDSMKYGFTSNRQLFKSPGANWHVYWMKQKSSDLFIFEITLVYTLPLLFFGELDITDAEDNPDECYITISTCKVRCNKDTAKILLEMRAYLNQVLESRIKQSSDGTTRHNKFEKHVLDAVIELLTAEDEKVEYINGEDDDVISVSDDSDHESSRRPWSQKRHARNRK